MLASITGSDCDCGPGKERIQAFLTSSKVPGPWHSGVWPVVPTYEARLTKAQRMTKGRAVLCEFVFTGWWELR